MNCVFCNRKNTFRSPVLSLLSHPIVTYATKQLTQALQDLTSRAQEARETSSVASTFSTRVISPERLRFSSEVEQFLREKQEYAQNTRGVSVGSY